MEKNSTGQNGLHNLAHEYYQCINSMFKRKPEKMLINS